MARHWTAYTPNVSDKQGYALDKIAQENGLRDGMELLCDITGDSRSRVQKDFRDYATARGVLDQAFARSSRA